MASGVTGRDRLPGRRWLAIGAGALILLEVLCRVLVLSSDSLPVDIMEDPYRSFQMKPGSRGVSAFGVTFDINSIGLRSPEVVSPKPAGVFRVLVLGDSMTLGYGLPAEATYPRVIERALAGQKIEVINAAAAGQPSQDQVSYLEHYGLALEPDLVVYGFSMEAIGPPPKLTIRGGVGYDAERNVSSVPPFAKKLLRHSRLYLAMGRLLLAHDAPDPSPEVRNATFNRLWAAAEGSVFHLRDLCETHHLPLMVLYVPLEVELERGVQYPALLEQLGALGHANYDFVNTMPNLTREGDPQNLYLPLDPAHLNARGQQVIARTVLAEPFFRSTLPPGTHVASD